MLYFAYGSNMALAQMSHRCPRSKFVGRGILYGYRWQINERGYANVVKVEDTAKAGSTKLATGGGMTANHRPSAPTGACVHGLIYELDETGEDEAKLDVYEGVRTSAYQKMYADVVVCPSTYPEYVAAYEATGHSVPPFAGTKYGDPSKPATAKGVLVYFSDRYITAGAPKLEYVNRMKAGMWDAYHLGVPVGYLERDLIPHLENNREKASSLASKNKKN
ncbi:uncharacterized protein SPSK_07980 [Sporothrix schenckii 1099-18]|uniref:gamma-glutamylcyclotransferase n=2 Tax=Sporothrix schenckii TaxID=29908 RepID=U7PZQ4_SPOS1|nr:uncharacterized protein SPSK_07980 [Sporothrix schenckii 1099-18]ERT01134.1 hypothetical protein HMPREF1624_02374 [Sporothrix schenckii ATCC 58251]KJR88268.1 hypothetical protein SPSK_07980 [Sporothrix schenckii 1099-18]